jgi:DNA-binding LacI/PurR family transcriptional regulator
VSRKRDIKQFRQACKEAGLTAQERYVASEALHAEKGTSSAKAHMSYGELLAWLRQWRQR